MIREPDGVDFVIRSEPLTPEGIAEIQDWIRKQGDADSATKPPLKASHAKSRLKKGGRAARSGSGT